MRLINSPIQTFSFRGLDFFIKRDDLLSEEFSGNKARKFAYFLANPPLGVDTIISYGSNQSNAMYSLSVLAKNLHVDFLYVCKHIPEFLKQNPIGNYKKALENGMQIYEHENPSSFYLGLKKQKSLHVKEGGAQEFAEFGLKQLAKEINEFAKDKLYDIFLPSGTGTTALYLQKHTHLKVFTTPCVGDKEYLRNQFRELVDDEVMHPQILSTCKKYHFGKPKKELFYMYKDLLEQTGIEFDLLYDPVGWIALFENLNSFKHPIVYIHQGGLLGNESLLQRYKYKNIA